MKFLYNYKCLNINVLLFLITLPFFGFGQFVEKIMLGQTLSVKQLNLQTPAQALIIVAEDGDFDQIELRLDGIETKFSRDPHLLLPDRRAQSNIVFLDQPFTLIELSSKSSPYETEVYLIRLPKPAPAITKPPLKSNCELPPIILQQEWRAGLPDPDYVRMATNTRNIIVHHAATSNNITDYVGLVRSIYLGHTQVNGWSDIGYNYLIAADGSLFAGRDPGIVIEQDEVLGAHFCAGNSGTMGICLLGNFMQESPTAEAMHTLVELLAWKTAKDSLSPFAINPHPLNAQLPVIAGHRQGCSTSCPGDQLFEQLHPLREAANHELENCGIFLSEAEILAQTSLQLFPNPWSTGFLRLNLSNQEVDNLFFIVKITNMNGKLLYQGEISGDGQFQPQPMLEKGIFIVTISQGEKRYHFKLVKI